MKFPISLPCNCSCAVMWNFIHISNNGNDAKRQDSLVNSIFLVIAEYYLLLHSYCFFSRASLYISTEKFVECLLYAFGCFSLSTESVITRNQQKYKTGKITNEKN